MGPGDGAGIADRHQPVGGTDRLPQQQRPDKLTRIARAARLCPPGLAALAIILVVTGVLWSRSKVEDFTVFDQPFYLGIAHDLVETGRFTNGFMFAAPGPDGKRPSGMRFAPLYPAVLAGAADLDGGLRQGMACLVATSGKMAGCPKRAPSMRWLQYGELVGFFWLVWWMANAAGGRSLAGWSLFFALWTAPLLLRSVNYLMTEMTCLLLTAAAMAAAIKAVQAVAAHARAARIAWGAAAGALLALSALTRPAFLYLIPACVIGALILGRRRALLPVVAMSVAAALVLAPWITRNETMFGRPTLTYGYDSHTLVQRIAFDTMTWREYGMAYMCWLPDGNEIGRDFAGAGACDRFGWDEHPNSFYVLGLRHLLYATLAASGGYAHHLSYLLRTYIFRMPLKHALVTIPLALRGAYISHWWGFVLLIASLVWAAKAWRGRQAAPAAFNEAVYLVAVLPAFFMLVFNAAVAVNQVRYNLMLIPAYAIAGGLTARWLAGRYRIGAMARVPVGRV